MWRTAPAAFHAERRQEAQQWRTRTLEREQGAALGTSLAIEQHALGAALTTAHAHAAGAINAFDQLDAECTRLQTQRRQHFDGKPAQEIAAALHSTVVAARTNAAAHAETASQQAASETRCTEALAQAQQHLANMMQVGEQAQGALTNWLEQFAALDSGVNDGENGTIRSSSQDQAASTNARLTATPPTAATESAGKLNHLRSLLAHPSDWIATERQQLQDLSAALAQASTVLAERRQQIQQHQAKQPPLPGDAPLPGLAPAHVNDPHSELVAPAEAAEHPPLNTDPIISLNTALEALRLQRQSATEHATGLQLALAQDASRLQASATMLVQLTQQEAVHRRWAQLSELIGSSDGKKFRNYAQQFTLDVLLGYANSHLHDLSHRYQLQRVDDTLALMVVDQDMADDLRSVHSLSGGEGFLVSLALALGLASLSSNRVRVESLFIDEGFGSLDADTLRVAMDALDGLQAMGRKVGVISHVQEMTERIGVKVLVERMAAGRSRVVVV